MCPWALHVVSVHAELTLGHLRYRLTDVPPQSNSPSDSVLGTGCRPVATALMARISRPVLRTRPQQAPPSLARAPLRREALAHSGSSPPPLCPVRWPKPPAPDDCYKVPANWLYTRSGKARPAKAKPPSQRDRVSGETARVEVFHWRTSMLPSLLCYTSGASPQNQTRVKLNRVFFPRCMLQARSPACGFAR